MRLINAGRGGIVDEQALADAIRDGRMGGAAIDTFAKELDHGSPLFELDNVVVTPHLGASTVEAQDKAGETIAEQVVLAFAATSFRSRSMWPRRRRRRRCARSCPSPNGWAGCSRAWPAARPSTLEIYYEGELADYDCRVLTLSILKGVLGPGRRRAGVVRRTRRSSRRSAVSRSARPNPRTRATT